MTPLTDSMLFQEKQYQCLDRSQTLSVKRVVPNLQTQIPSQLPARLHLEPLHQQDRQHQAFSASHRVSGQNRVHLVPQYLVRPHSQRQEVRLDNLHN